MRTYICLLLLLLLLSLSLGLELQQGLGLRHRGVAGMIYASLARWNDNDIYIYIYDIWYLIWLWWEYSQLEIFDVQLLAKRYAWRHDYFGYPEQQEQEKISRSNPAWNTNKGEKSHEIRINVGEKSPIRLDDSESHGKGQTGQWLWLISTIMCARNRVLPCKMRMYRSRFIWRLTSNGDYWNGVCKCVCVSEYSNELEERIGLFQFNLLSCHCHFIFSEVLRNPRCPSLNILEIELNWIEWIESIVSRMYQSVLMPAADRLFTTKTTPTAVQRSIQYQ